MKAHAELVVERVGGSDRITTMRSDPPLTLRATRGAVHLVASGAGPVGGDDLSLTVRVRPDASLDLRSVAASMAHPGPTGLASHLAIEIEVADGASLRWSPQPAILVAGCDHHVRVHIRLGRDAALLWRDEVVLGRQGERTGSVLQRLRVDLDGRPLLRNDLALGPAHAGSLGSAGCGVGTRAVGTLLAVGADADHVAEAVVPTDGLRWASTRLGAGGAVLVTAVAEAPGVLGRALDVATADPQTTPVRIVTI